jgi:hypothetical protein
MLVVLDGQAVFIEVVLRGGEADAVVAVVAAGGFGGFLLLEFLAR